MTIVRRRRRPGLSLPAFLAAMVGAAWVTAQIPAPAPVAKRAHQIYSAPSPTLRFSHQQHAGESCTSCHGAALTSRRAGDSLRPAMSVCVECHNRVEEAPPIAQCGTCHVGYAHRATGRIDTPEQWRAERPAPMVLPQAPPALRFDHSRHVPRMGGESSCVNCHAGAEPTMPTMQSCTTCHDGSTAPAACVTCHSTGPDGKLRGGRQAIDEPLRPSNHTVDFMKRHGSVAKSGMQECMACHVEQDCLSCHNASMAKPFAVHPPGFLTIHAVDARANGGNCTDCHTVQTFCTSCHVRADVMGAPPHAPPAQRQFHPPGWVDASAANNHGVMARRDIVECASCHSEADCITCHAGINPHPPEFAMSCRRMLASNGRSCGKCHSDLSGLRALCP